MTKIIVDAAFSLSLLLGAIYLWFVAEAFPKLERYKGIDSDFWPKILVTLVAVLAVVLLYQSFSALQFMRRVKARASEDTVNAAAGDASNICWKKLTCAAGLVVLYFLGLQTLGFVGSTVVFLILAINLLGYENKLMRRLFPWIFTALVTVIFVKVLSMPLPRGVGVFETLSRMFY